MFKVKRHIQIFYVYILQVNCKAAFGISEHYGVRNYAQ